MPRDLVTRVLCPQTGSGVSSIEEKGCYLSLVKALQGCLLARNRAISTVRFEKAGVKESGECGQTAGDF